MVLREVCVLWVVCLSDPLWLPNARARKLPHQELQLCQPLFVSRVRALPCLSLVEGKQWGGRRADVPKHMLIETALSGLRGLKQSNRAHGVGWNGDERDGGGITVEEMRGGLYAGIKFSSNETGVEKTQRILKY